MHNIKKIYQFLMNFLTENIEHQNFDFLNQDKSDLTNLENTISPLNPSMHDQ